METSRNAISTDGHTLRFPFLGSIEDGELFEYLLYSIDNDTVEIAILNWFLNRVKLHKEEKVHLHLPFLNDTENILKDNISGIVISAKNCDEIPGQIYQVSLSLQKKESLRNNNDFNLFAQLPSKESLKNLLLHFIKDSMILKEGVRVYFKHLIPYFSRIANYSHQEYAKIETFLLRDIEMRIMSNKANLEKIYQVAKEKITHLDQVSIYLDLEVLRETLETEISLSVFNIVFSEDKTQNILDLSLAQPQYGIFMYINAIKVLERRLYSNYNHIVIIYLESLKT